MASAANWTRKHSPLTSPSVDGAVQPRRLGLCIDQSVERPAQRQPRIGRGGLQPWQTAC